MKIGTSDRRGERTERSTFGGGGRGGEVNGQRHYAYAYAYAPYVICLCLRSARITTFTFSF